MSTSVPSSQRANRRRPDHLDPNLTVFSTPQAARYAGLSISYLEVLRRIGGGPAYSNPTPRIVRYLKADLDAWLASRRRHNTSGDGQGRGGPTDAAAA